MLRLCPEEITLTAAPRVAGQSLCRVPLHHMISGLKVKGVAVAVLLSGLHRRLLHVGVFRAVLQLAAACLFSTSPGPLHSSGHQTQDSAYGTIGFRPPGHTEAAPGTRTRYKPSGQGAGVRSRQEGRSTLGVPRGGASLYLDIHSCVGMPLDVGPSGQPLCAAQMQAGSIRLGGAGGLYVLRPVIGTHPSCAYAVCWAFPLMYPNCWAFFFDP